MKTNLCVCLILTIGSFLARPAPGQPNLANTLPVVSRNTKTLPAFTRIVGGSNYSCALTAGGGVMCWGSNGAGQLGDGTTLQRSIPEDVSGLTGGVTALAAGGPTCAVASGGGVKCWGSNGSGELGNGTQNNSSIPVDVTGLTSGVVAVATGVNHACALTSGGGVMCWGNNDAGQLGNGIAIGSSVPVDVNGLGSGVKAIAAGPGYTCAVTVSGGAKCWGSNDYGQLGDGTTNSSNVPVDVSGLGGDVTAVVMGQSHTCALTSIGGVECWGANWSGQLGDGTTLQRNNPVSVSGLTSGVTALAAGGSHTCAVTSDGGVKCWGAYFSGLISGGPIFQSSLPVDVNGLTDEVFAIGAGNNHTCLVTVNGGIKCWGDNTYGQLGDGTSVWHSIPIDVREMEIGVTAMAAGSTGYTCALTSAGGVRCWGDNYYGQLGNGTTIDNSLPVDVSGLASGITALVTGQDHACALTSSGGVKCWGSGGSGELGDGTNNNSSVPLDVIGLSSGVTALAAGDHHACAVISAGGVKCWGLNSQGQLGDGTTTSSLAPVDVIGLASGITALAAGAYRTCALTSEGGVKCWGNNSAGQLGDGTRDDSSVPVDVNGLASGVKGIATEGDHTCAVTASGGVKCWGVNWSGQLGDGTLNNSNVPVDVAGLTTPVAQVVTGGGHTCALTTDGGVKCWGGNGRGQLGDGTIDSSSTPVDVSGLASNVMGLAAGGAHTCAVLADGRPKCWGADDAGQLGLGIQLFQLTPVDVAESSLSMSYPTGQPSSYFTITGENFFVNGNQNSGFALEGQAAPTLTVSINNVVLTTTLQTNETAGFIFFISTYDADTGFYTLTVKDGSIVVAQNTFFLDKNWPHRSQEGGGLTIPIPAGISINHSIYLPLIAH